MKVQGIEKLFPFDGWVVESIGFAPDLVQVKLRRHRRKRLTCMCGASMTSYRETTQSARDLPLATAKDVLIFYPAILARCPKCKQTQTFLPPGIQPYAKATDRFMRYISLLARFLPIAQVTKVTGIPAATARRWDKHILTQDLPPVDLDGIAILLIDEKHLGPTLGFVTIVMDDLGNPLYMAEGKKKESLQGFFDMLDEEQKAGILAVCIDRAGQYKAVVEKNCPQADIVFDKFHLKKNLNDAVDETRRQEWRTAEKTEKSAIKGQRYNLLRAPANNTPEQAKSLKRLLGLNENLHTAYVLREAFGKTWDYLYRRPAEKYLERWVDWAIESAVKPIVTFAKSVWKSKENVLNFIDWRITTSRLECLNGMIERIQRRCCGLTDLKYLFLKIRQAALYAFHLQT